MVSVSILYCLRFCTKKSVFDPRDEDSEVEDSEVVVLEGAGEDSEVEDSEVEAQVASGKI